MLSISKRLLLVLILPLFISLCLSAGCSQTAQTDSQPVTIKIANPSGGYLTDQEFQRYIVEPVKKRYPNITVEKITMATGNNEIPQLMADSPDIIIQSGNTMSNLKDAGFTFNIEPLIQKYHVDLSRFEPIALEAAKNASGGDYVAVLPYTRHFQVIYYNKDIFDKFGVKYPRDGMTWDDVIALARQVTKNVDGKQYRGLEPDSVFRMESQLGLGYVDSNSKAVVNTDKWKYVFETIKSIYDIPGNDKISTGAIDQFTKDRILAMFPNNNQLPILEPISNEFNWDMVSYPTYKEAPGTGFQYDAHMMILSANSSHKDAAFQVMMTVLSDEVQLDLSKNGRLSVMQDPKIKAAFGENLPFLKGKNVQAIYKTTPAKPYSFLKYDDLSKPVLIDAMNSVVQGKLDINTALLQAQDKISQIVAQNP